MDKFKVIQMQSYVEVQLIYQVLLNTLLSSISLLQFELEYVGENIIKPLIFAAKPVT